MRLQGKVALVTGAGRGIGFAIAGAFAREGAYVFAADIHEQRLQAAVKALRDEFGEDVISGWPLDVSKREQVRGTVQMILDARGRIDVLVNNAGIGVSTPFLELTDAAWDSVMNVNLKGAFYCCQEVLPAMIRQGSGVIINIGSTNGMRGQPTMAHYNASKAGLISLTQTLAVEFACHGIRVNCLCPGSIATELNLVDSGWDEAFLQRLKEHIPLRRFGQPEEVAGACVYLASDDAAFMSGQTVVLDGGMLAQQ